VVANRPTTTFGSRCPRSGTFRLFPWDAVHDDFSTTPAPLVERLDIEGLEGRECHFKTMASKCVAFSQSRTLWIGHLAHGLHLLLAASLSCLGLFALAISFNISSIRTAPLFHFALSLGVRLFVGIYRFSHSSPSSLLGANNRVHQQSTHSFGNVVFFFSSSFSSFGVSFAYIFVARPLATSLHTSTSISVIFLRLFPGTVHYHRTRS